MKLYRIRRLLDRPFECLFVTKVTTISRKGGSTRESFKYIDNAKPMLNKLLECWSILELVDISDLKKRGFYWQP